MSVSKANRVLVTGALGHIGSRFIRDLPAAFPGVQVLLLDDLSTQRYCSLFGLPGNGNYRFIEGNVLTANLHEICAGTDVVVHLAAATDAASSHDRAEHYERTNFLGTERIALACAESGSRLLFPSTTSVYGSQDAVVDEDCPVAQLKPQSPYAEAKLKAEDMLSDLARSKGLRHVTCRLGTIYGVSAGMRFHTAVNRFCWQSAMGIPLSVWKTALHQMRPYLDLSDASAAMIAIMEGDWFDGRIYNVLTENATVNDILSVIGRRICDLRVDYVDSRIMNQLSYTVRSDRFRERGFTFKGNLEQGIGETIALLRNANRR